MASIPIALFWLLIVFHAGLLVQRVGAGELLEAGVLVRYGLSFLLLVGLWVLRRQGHSLLWGRRALVVWLAIFMLHASFAGVSDVVSCGGGCGVCPQAAWAATHQDAQSTLTAQTHGIARPRERGQRAPVDA